MTNNLVSYFIDSALVTAGKSRVPNADFDGGMNNGASNACGVGIATGLINPKASDWPRISDLLAVKDSQVIGGNLSGIFILDPDFVGDDNLTQFCEATGAVAPDGVIASVAGFDMVNRSGEDMVDGDWAWGVADQV